MKLTTAFKAFFESEKSSGFILIFCTIISLLLANSALQHDYLKIWETQIGTSSLEHWINDGLMAIFFLLIGLELKREIFVGELSNPKKALLPAVGALGGMILPAMLFLLFNYNTSTQSGAGIPMATDIAFAVGILSLLGSRVPLALKVFLTALAVIDDLGAIIVIALFYSGSPNWIYLGGTLGIFAILLVLNKLKVKYLIVYLLGGIIMWYFMLHSGVHATITGVLLAFAIPFNKGSFEAPSYVLEKILHKPTAYIILPLFALANTAIVISGNLQETITQNYSLGIASGLVIGKPLGIILFSYLAVKLGFCELSNNINWKQMLGVGFLGGIGFTMSIFVTLLAFTDADIINNAKLMILLSSLTASLLGFIFLQITLRKSISTN
jgi:Na+:H+ antiporter, NhaA family